LGSDWTNLRVCDTIVSQGKTLDEASTPHILAADGADNIIWWCSQQVRDDGELVDVILSREERLALEHLCENASCTPNIHFHIVLLPREHDLRSAVVSCRDISSHLRVLDAGETEIANLQVAVLIDQDVRRLEISVNDTGGVDVFQTALSGN
jgi:hypothetical protein